MHINISTPSQQHLDSIQQILMFYHVRLKDRVQFLNLNLHEVPDRLDNDNFRVELDATLLSGQRINLEEVQTDLLTATNRILNRLIRMCGRSVLPDRLMNNA